MKNKLILISIIFISFLNASESSLIKEINQMEEEINTLKCKLSSKEKDLNQENILKNIDKKEDFIIELIQELTDLHKEPLK